MLKDKYFVGFILIVIGIVVYNKFIKNTVSGDANDESNDNTRSIFPASMTTIDKYAGTRAGGSGVTEKVFCPNNQRYDRASAMCVDLPSTLRSGKLKKRARKMKKQKPRFF